MAYCAGMGKVAIIGQSLCTGYGSTGYPDGAVDYQPTERGWWAQFEAAHTDTEWRNYAHNGAMASDFRPGGRWPAAVGAVDDITAWKPNIVVIMLGGNEFFQGINPQGAYWQNLDHIVGRLHTSSGARLYVMSEYDFPPELAEGDHPQSAYREVAALVAANHNATYVNLAWHMPPTSDNSDGYYLPDEYGPGLSVHLTDAGHDRLAQVVGDTILPCSVGGE